jgi:hypothetical protein
MRFVRRRPLEAWGAAAPVREGLAPIVTRLSCLAWFACAAAPRAEIARIYD